MRMRWTIGVAVGLIVLVPTIHGLVSAQGCGKCDGAPIKEDQPVPKKRSEVKKIPGAVLGTVTVPAPTPPPGTPPPPTPAHPPEEPDHEYDTFSFFLIPTLDWEIQNHGELPRLHEAFQDFSGQIGGRHLAVWFTGANIHGVDTGRNQIFCRRFNLPFEQGPYVVMMRKHPDDLKQTDQVLTIQLNDINAARVMNVLKVLVEDLHSGAAIHEQAIELERLMQIFLSAKDRKGLGGIAIALVKPPR